MINSSARPTSKHGAEEGAEEGADCEARRDVCGSCALTTSWSLAYDDAPFSVLRRAGDVLDLRARSPILPMDALVGSESH